MNSNLWKYSMLVLYLQSYTKMCSVVRWSHLSGKNSLEAILYFQLSYSLVSSKTITNSNQSLSMYSIQTVWKIYFTQKRNALHLKSTIAFRIENFHLNSNTFTIRMNSIVLQTNLTHPLYPNTKFCSVKSL